MGWSNVAADVLQATTVIVSGTGSNTGIFIYSGNPAAGNLIGSWTGAAGTDPYGNTFPKGLALYDASSKLIGNWDTTGFEIIGPSGSGKIFVQPVFSATQSPELQFTDGSTPVGALASEIFVLNGAMFSGQDALIILGSGAPMVTDSHESQIEIQLSAGNSADGARGVLNFSGSATETYISLDKTGAQMTGFVTAPQPTTSPATPENWHNLLLNAGFTGLAGAATPRYQQEGTGAGRVRLDGVVQLTANQAQHAVIASFSGSYTPLANKFFSTANNLSGGATNVESIVVTNTGNVELGVSGSNGNYVSLDGITFPNND